jgi:amidase
VPTSDDLYVGRVRRAGAIVIGKTNTPEFGAGSQTRGRAQLKDTVVWNIEQGLELEPADLERAARAEAALDARVAAFFAVHEFLVLPTVQLLPFPVEIEWPREIEGVAMHTYIDWMATCYAISCTGLPAISVPCGFSPDGLPVGLQIVGRRHGDADVLALARAFEQATRFALRRPPVVFE